jgi:HPt (histidine-containing phosphotransfer) domain-containing protein
VSEEPPAARIDRAALDALRALSKQTGQDLLGRILDAYAASAEKLVAEIVSAAARADAEAIRRAAHTLKSGSANVGATDIAARALRLEELGSSGSTEGASALARDLPARLATVLEELERERRS